MGRIRENISVKNDNIWGIKLDLENEKLDMSNYPKEFLEFVDLL